MAGTKDPQTTLNRPALIILCATIFLSVTNASMTSLALPKIASDFDVKADDLSWVVTAYLIPFATGSMIYGRLADMFGTRRLYLFGLTVFALASFATAAAPSFGLLIGARVLQGMGGTAIPSLSLATIIRTTSPADRGSAMGATIMVLGLGFASGPLVGGMLTSVAGWHGPFLAMGAGGAVLLPFAARYIPGLPGSRELTFDYAGAVLIVGAVTGAILALNRLPRDVGDPLGVAGLITAIPLAVLLVVRMRTARDPFIHREIAANGRFWGLSVLGLTVQGGHFAVLTVIPLLLAKYYGIGAIETGLYLVPGALAIAALGMAGGALLNRVGARFLLCWGAAILLAGVVVFHVAGVGWRPAGIAALYVAVAAGYGMVNAAVITTATGVLPARLAGLGSGTYNLVYFLGGAISVALVGAILRSRESATDALDPLFSGEPVAYSDALLVCVGFAILGLILALSCAPRRPTAASRADARTPEPASR